MRDLVAEKQKVKVHLDALAKGADPAGIFAPGAVAQIVHPWGIRTGPARIGEFYRALRVALPDQERREDLFLAGENHPDDRVDGPRFTPLVASLGALQATFTAPLLGIPPTHGVVHLRLAEVHHLNPHGRIVRSWLFPDLLDLIDQAGHWPIAPMLGAPGLWPGPKGGHGARHDSVDPQGGAESLGRVLAMHDALHEFDGISINSMPMSAWSEHFMYYAAAGIGISRGLDGFRAHHQVPFLHAFPDRRGAGHFIRIGDGPFAVTGGAVAITHSREYLGMAPTGRALTAQVMDFYHLDAEGRICENWLPFDILGLAAQMGVNVLSRVHHRTGRPKRDIH
ncbi:MAG: ester cyclase [Rhodobacteraceae bacterium]|nr:ester cyclase [Paracoccaceae bacterium]